MAKTEMNLEVTVGLTVRDGDTLIVAGGKMTSEQAAEVRDRLMARIPGLADVVVIGANQVAAYRPNKENP